MNAPQQDEGASNLPRMNSNPREQQRKDDRQITHGDNHQQPVYIMSFLVGAVILQIQDNDRPGAGFISVSQQPLSRAIRAEFEDTAPRRR
jgi:hypothetical protein